MREGECQILGCRMHFDVTKISLSGLEIHSRHGSPEFGNGRAGFKLSLPLPDHREGPPPLSPYPDPSPGVLNLSEILIQGYSTQYPTSPFGDL